MNQPTLFPPTARLTFVQRAMALSDPQWQSIEPKRELVFPLGEPQGNDDRRWRFLPEDLAAVAADFASRKEQAPALYKHGEDPARGGMAAGWIDRVEVADDGLYAYIRYTEKALAEIKDGGWGYRSPGFDAEQDEDGYWRPRRLSEVSLVNDPAIAGMPPIKAAVSTEPEGSLPAATNGNEEDCDMGDSKTVTAAKKNSAAFDKAGLLGVIRETFAMPEAISDDMLIDLLKKAVEDVVEEVKDMAPEEPAMDLPMPAAASVEKPRIELVETIDDVKAEAVKNERVIAAVRKAASLGTITPQTLDAAGKLAVADVESFETLFCSLPAPAAGQLINASAKDRSTKPGNYADQIRAQRNAAIGAARQ